MLSEIVVRTSTANDESEIERHRSLSLEESRQYRGTPLQASLEPSLSFVAIVGETIVGSLSVGFDANDIATITHVFVEPEARDVGVGDSLLRYTMHNLLARGITYLAASAQPGDRSLKNLFERHGLVAQTIIVGRTLSDPSTEEHASQ